MALTGEVMRTKKETFKCSNLLCAIGIHRPLKGHTHNFIDKVSGQTVYNAECPCGKKWMVDSPFSFGGFKVERVLQNNKWKEEGNL